VVTTTTTLDHARAVAASVVDPEIPVLNLADLGILRDVSVDGERVTVTITPTYSGCPAIEVIQRDVRSALHDAGFEHVDVRLTLSPPWTTDWMSEDGRRKLREFGIAPPGPATSMHHGAETSRVTLALTVRCPQCGSPRTRELSRFGSTACKALWVCDDCLEPFDSFKSI
jgi:ring-1,2-phenylacetyl-CoA epoxidase subunit PaaD